jgi:hypothetical protein
MATHARGKAQANAVTDLQAFLSKQQFEKSRPKFDPNHLPFGTPKPLTRAPSEDRVALYKMTHSDVQLAASTVTPEMLSGLFGQRGGVEADLAETIDTTQTQAIKDLATQLHNNPTEIYTWVANNIRFVPSYGSIQGADMTLQTKRGNAMDTASLLISLLRTAGIPARYAYGTVQMPIDKAMNWVGGVTVPEAAANLMQQGGIPTSLVATNGVITHIKFEHTWVEAWVDYEPSRGMKNIEGDNWMPMDASYKQYDYTQPTVDLKTAVPFDAQGLANTIQQQSTVNEQEGWVQNLPQQAIQDSLTNYQTQLQNYLTTQQPNATVGDVLGIQQTKVLPIRPLAAGLPYQLIAKQSNFSEVADNLRLKFKYELYTSNYGEPDQQLFKMEQPTVRLAGKKLAMSFKPATQQDQDLIASYIPAPDPATGQIDTTKLPSSLPGYLIHLVPEFTLDNTTVASSTVQQTMGTEVVSVMGYKFPGKEYETTQNLPIAGQYEALALDLQGVSVQQVEKLKSDFDLTKGMLERNNYIDINKHNIVGDLLYTTILAYFSLNDIAESLDALTSRVQYRAPSRGLFQTSLQAQYWFGIPRNVIVGGLMMDVDGSYHTAAQKNNNHDDWVILNRALGMRESAMEHLIPELIFSTPNNSTHGISAVKALKTAMLQGQRIYTITESNISSVLPSITLPIEVINDIQNSVYSGKEVITHQSAIDFYGNSEVGYLIIDPDTGAGAYKIATGANGSLIQFLLVFLMVIIAVMVIAELVLAGSLGLALVAGTWEWINFQSWVNGMRQAKDPQQYSANSFGSFMGALLGTLGGYGVITRESLIFWMGGWWMYFMGIM